MKEEEKEMIWQSGFLSGFAESSFIFIGCMLLGRLLSI
jgi:hypothetical protein